MTQAQLKVLVRDACSRKIAEFQTERAQFKAGMKRCSDSIRKEKKKRARLLQTITSGVNAEDFSRLLGDGGDQAGAPAAGAPPGRAPEGPGVSAA